MSQYIFEMKLSEIFEITIKMIGKTFVRNIIICCLLILPPSLVMVVAAYVGASSMAATFAQYAESFGSEYTPDPFGIEFAEALLSGLVFLVVIFIALLVLFATSLWAYVAITRITAAEMNEETVSWQSAIRESLSMTILSVFGQQMLAGLAITAVIVVPYGIMFWGIIAQEVALMMFGMLGLIAVLPLAIYLQYRWVFAPIAIIWEGAGVMESFSRSWELVRGRWWRVFGILLLLEIAASFAVSLASTPITMFVFFIPYFNLIFSISGNGTPSPTDIANMIASLVVGYCVMILVTVILTYLVNPAIHVVVYFDSKARNGEIPSPETPQVDSPEEPNVWNTLNV